LNTILLWLILAITPLVISIFYSRWRDQIDDKLAIDRTAVIRDFLLNTGFTEFSRDDLQQITGLKKLSPAMTLFEYHTKEGVKNQTILIHCMISRSNEDSLEISFDGFLGEDNKSPFLGTLSFVETRLGKKPRLCLNENLPEEVIDYFKQLSRDTLGKLPPQFRKIYGPINSSLIDELNKPISSRFSFLYVSLYFFFVYFLTLVSGVSPANFLVSLLIFSIIYILLVWKLPYLRDEDCKWQKRRWQIFCGILFIPCGLMLTPLLYPFEWGTTDLTMVLFFSALYGLAHGQTQMAIQSLFLR